MTLATRSGVDTAGGGIVTGPSHVQVDGAPWAVVGAAVASHGSGPHAAATIPSGSSHVLIGGAVALVEGDLASCGDAATGSGHLSLGG